MRNSKCAMDKKKSIKGLLHVGTSGIVVPGAKAGFPPEFQNQSRLHYYASLFNTLEVNSSFYKVPLRATFEKWAADVPLDFQFTVKLWRGITHAKDLIFEDVFIDRFMQAIDGLGDKKGCLLIQFPASIRIAHKVQVEALLKRLMLSDPDHAWRKAVEFRHVSWYSPDIFRLLEQYQAVPVFHDMPRSKIMLDETQSDWVYMRFHGPAGDYKGSYNADQLREQAERTIRFLQQDKDVYIYFNNTIGDAYENAQTLSTFLKAE